MILCNYVKASQEHLEEVKRDKGTLKSWKVLILSAVIPIIPIHCIPRLMYITVECVVLLRTFQSLMHCRCATPVEAD